MDFEALKHALAHHCEIIQSLVGDVDPEQAHWRPAADAWTIVEIVNHLYDEEREDFRAHLDQTLHQPGQPWSEINPFKWITERRYNERDLAASLQAFLAERRASLAWLDGLTAPNWDAVTVHPVGEIRAGDVLASWVVHDQWHLQQIIQRRCDYTIAQAAPYDAHYSGALG